jgi:hypothetical protein
LLLLSLLKRSEDNETVRQRKVILKWVISRYRSMKGGDHLEDQDEDGRITSETGGLL